MSKRQKLVREALERELGRDPGVWREARVGGGSINAAARLHCGEQSFFLKWNQRQLPHHFESEAAGLREMAAAESGFVLPRVIAYADGEEAFLLLSDLGEGRARRDYDESFGRALAQLHRRSDDRGFGFGLDGYCGATPQPNGWMERWLDFYRERRLGHMLRLAEQRGLPDASRLHDLIDHLHEWLEEPSRSSLIHGDLWSGNAHVDAEGSPAILDPATYYADREAELGMMQLFGGFSERVIESYQEAFPLRPGWEERVGLYMLYHVLNHFVLFGGGYGRQALQIAGRYGY